MRRQWSLALALACIAIFFGGTVGLASHKPGLAWMGDCCGLWDCETTTVALLEIGITTSMVMVGDRYLVLPNDKVRASQDGHGYWCFYPTYKGAFSMPEQYTDKIGRAHV